MPGATVPSSVGPGPQSPFSWTWKPCRLGGRPRRSATNFAPAGVLLIRTAPIGWSAASGVIRYISARNSCAWAWAAPARAEAMRMAGAIARIPRVSWSG
jgi:hypothetical protein